MVRDSYTAGRAPEYTDSTQSTTWVPSPCVPADRQLLTHIVTIISHHFINCIYLIYHIISYHISSIVSYISSVITRPKDGGGMEVGRDVGWLMSAIINST